MPIHLQYIQVWFTGNYNEDKAILTLLSHGVYMNMFICVQRIQITFTWQERIQLIKDGGNYKKFTKFQKSYNL